MRHQMHIERHIASTIQPFRVQQRRGEKGVGSQAQNHLSSENFAVALVVRGL